MADGWKKEVFLIFFSSLFHSPFRSIDFLVLGNGAPGLSGLRLKPAGLMAHFGGIPAFVGKLGIVRSSFL